MRKQALVSILLLALLALPTVFAQGQVRVVVNRDFVNLRLYPALGSQVLGNANAGTTFVLTGRSPDNQWYRIDFAGGEAWVGSVVVTVLEGDPNSLPIRDPRSIPYGGSEAPRAGVTDATSDIRARLPNSGVRVRSGPTVAYPVLADAPRYTVMPLLGRTADSAWVQVNFEGTLGWVKAEFIEIQDNRNILELPVDGVVASGQSVLFTDQNELFAVLRLMRERLDLAQPSLDTQRQVWTDAALGLTPACGGYPARPSNFNVPREILAQYFGTLEPLLADFNAAMTDLRDAIDLQIETCNRPGGDIALTSAPVVTGGLELVSEADRRFASLRRRIDELLPEISPNDCVFAFGGRVEVLPFIASGELVQGEFEADDRAIGFCINATPADVARVELLRGRSNYRVVVAVTPLDNPTNFIASGTGGASETQNSVILSPINYPVEGRYILIVSIEPNEGEVPEGEYALLYSAQGDTAPQLDFDEEGNIIQVEPTTPGDTGGVTTVGTVTNVQASPINVYITIDTASGVVGTIAPGESVQVLGTVTGWVQVQLPGGIIGWVQDGLVSFDTDDTGDGGAGDDSPQTAQCPGLTLTCVELFNCAEVQACVDAGSTQLDPNGNGIACDSSEEPLLSCNVVVP